MTRTPHTTQRLLICLALAITAGLCYLNAISHGQDDAETPSPVRPVSLNQSPAEARIAAALDQKTTLEFVETPLSDVVAYLSELHNIPVLIDKYGLEGEGLTVDSAVTLNVRNIRLRSALNLMLKEFQLTYVIHNEVLQITTYEEAEAGLITHAYDVRDLMKSPYSEELEPDSLIEQITYSVAVQTWDEVGGPGSIAPYQGTLFVSQTQEVHEQVQAMLTQLRRAAHALEHDPQQAFATTWNADQLMQTEGTRKIKAALEKPIDKLEFVDTALDDIIAILQAKAEIPIVLDKRALDGYGIGNDSPLTASLSGVKLRSALNILLDELELAYIVRDEVLLITVIEEAESRMTTTTFIVRDLLDSPATASNDADELIDLIAMTVSPQTWEDVGGPGSISYFELLDALVITQTDETLKEVEHLLAKLRKIRKQHQPWSAQKWAKQREVYLKTPRFEYFTIPMNANGEFVVEPDTVVTYLKNSLDPSLIKQAQINVASNSITMFLKPAEVSMVVNLLKRANLPVYRSTYGFNGKGGGFSGSGGLNGSSGGFF